jgi:hypothetical protein
VIPASNVEGLHNKCANCGEDWFEKLEMLKHRLFDFLRLVSEARRDVAELTAFNLRVNLGIVDNGD